MRAAPPFHHEPLLGRGTRPSLFSQHDVFLNAFPSLSQTQHNPESHGIRKQPVLQNLQNTNNNNRSSRKTLGKKVNCSHQNHWNPSSILVVLLWTDQTNEYHPYTLKELIHTLNKTIGRGLCIYWLLSWRWIEGLTFTSWSGWLHSSLVSLCPSLLISRNW